MTFIATIIPQGSMNESELRSEELPEDPRSRLDFLKSIVGGYIEVVALDDGSALVFDEEGKLKKDRIPNQIATLLALSSESIRKDDFIVGNAVIVPMEAL